MRTPPSGRNPSDHGFFRRSLRQARLTESTCRKCRSFVAASIRPEMLDLMEKLHLCILGKHFPGKPITSA
ncbi:MAG TPA: hypothetical protein VFB76_05360 [Candidatus Angelobacter sp.]|nr:hypothetical protein [Candidatus Angelobacter sp.]